MNQKLYILSFILCLLLLPTAQGQFFNEQGLKFVQLFNWIDTRYVDSVNLNKLSDEIIRESLRKLDPHSKYFTKDETVAVNELLQGNYEGIGVTAEVYMDTVIVVSVISGGPAEKFGIKAGDRIIKVNDELVSGVKITQKQILSKIRGAKGVVLKIGIKRRDVTDLISFTIICDKIPISSVESAYKINDSTGYIRLARFSQTTIKEIDSVLTRFKSEKVKHIILDLSDNGGGSLEAAVALVDRFLDANKKVVYTKGLHEREIDFFSTEKGSFEKGKLVVIVDENSASASEVVAGAIQDWDRGIIVGRRSFGKGLVQNRFYFSDGTMAWITIARYYTPTGRLIQKPYNNGFDDYAKDLNNRYKHGELLNKDSIHFPDSLKYQTLIRKRTVFGGGGIMPDVFVPLDTSGYTTYYRDLLAKGAFYNFVIEYMDKNREQLHKTYPGFNQFKSKFIVDDSLLKALLAYAERQSLAFHQSEFAKSKKLLAVLLKASIARDLWGSSEYWEIYNTSNSTFVKSVEVINSYDSYFSK